jgi:glycosyltransferase involved in cell wall biosynthesis
MLRGAGATVDVLEADNDGIVNASQRLKAALQVPYSFSGRRRVADRIREFGPDIVHVHNFFPNLTPSVYDACHDAGVPVIQTLHNFRLICANALLFRDGSVCTECVSRTFPFPAIRHACYRQSRAGSTAVAAMISVHRLRKTWTRKVSRFIALTEFARSLFTTSLGIPFEQIAVKPNATVDPGLGDGRGGYALYVGRLSPEKGIETLLAAAGSSCGLGISLKVIGTGPLQQEVEKAEVPGRIEYLGFQDSGALQQLMRSARVLLIPSLWYEGLPMVVPEAFGTGLPIIASRIGALQSLIDHERDGLLVEPGDPHALAEAVRRITADSAFESSLRQQARQSYVARYQPHSNVRLLLQIYDEVRSFNPS